MKKGMILIVAVLACFFATMVHAALFVEDFESDLSNWTGKNQGTHHGEIVDDPLMPGNKVLKFVALNASGDIFTKDTFSSANGNFVLSFDYLGVNSSDSGGFIGYSYGFPGEHHWLGEHTLLLIMICNYCLIPGTGSI